jgi:hypothetical protein
MYILDKVGDEFSCTAVTTELAYIIRLVLINSKNDCERFKTNNSYNKPVQETAMPNDDDYIYHAARDTAESILTSYAMELEKFKADYGEY